MKKLVFRIYLLILLLFLLFGIAVYMVSLVGILSAESGVLILAWILVINIYVPMVGLIMFALFKELQRKMGGKNGW